MQRLVAVALISAGFLGAQNAAHNASAVPPARQYALLLEDAPVASQVSSRSQLRAAPGQTQSARIEAAQASLRQLLAERHVLVTGSVKHLLNGVFVAARPEELPALRALPGVRAIAPLREVRLMMDKALPLINVPDVSAAVVGLPDLGAGVRIGIIDTGIDASHPAFQDATLTPPSGFPHCTAGDCAFTNNKVIVARSYVASVAQGWTSNAAETSHPDDLSARDRIGHGTATAMVAAGMVHQAPRGSGTVLLSGVARKAFLGNYKVFGSPGINGMSTASAAVIQALDDAYALDDMDVVNLSLGAPAYYAPDLTGTFCDPSGTDPNAVCDVLAQAVETAVRHGMVVVVAAGNEGDSGLKQPALGTISSPGTAPSAITVGGTHNGHNLYSLYSVEGLVTLLPLMARFGDGPKPSAPLIAPLRDAGGLACGGLAPGSMTGAIALIQRGACTFAEKVRAADSAGAVGVVFYCSDTSYCADGGGTLFMPTGLTGTRIPAALIRRGDGQMLANYVGSHNDARMTLDPAMVESADSAVDTMADCSSRGPSLAPGTLKPELVAPATGLHLATQSYDPNAQLFSAGGYLAMDGTSFAAPMVAGAAAIVKQRNPAFTPAQIKSALVNTASDSPVVSGEPRVTAVGAGKLDVFKAMDSNVTVEPAALAFSGHPTIGTGIQKTLTVTNNSDAALTLGLDPPNPVLTLGPTSVAPHQTASVLVILDVAAAFAPDLYTGTITIRGAGTSLWRVPYEYVVSDGVLDNLIPLPYDAPIAFPGQQIATYAVCVRAVDRFGVGVVGLPVRWDATGGANFGTSGAFDTSTKLYGIACAQVFLGSTVGEQDVQATVGTLSYTFHAQARAQASIAAVVNGASWVATNGVLPSIAPGSYLSIFGPALSDATLAYFDRLAPGSARLPVALGDVSVSFDVPWINPPLSVPGRIHYVSPNQINVQVPWELQGQGGAEMKVNIGQLSTALNLLRLADAAPGIFLVDPLTPAIRGGTIRVYANGLGPVDHQPATGEVSEAARTTNTVYASIGGQPVTVISAGLTAGYIGLYEVQIQIGNGVPAGSQPLVLTVAGNSSAPATLVVQ